MLTRKKKVKMSRITKKEIVAELFKECERKGNFIFNNDLVKEVLVLNGSSTNPYDMTKLDDTSKFPDVLLENDYCLIHLGGGRHQFIKGIEKIFHNFEEITNEEVIDFPYSPSILNDYSTSESNILSVTLNHKLMHDFLYEKKQGTPKEYISERKNKVTFSYNIGDIKVNLEGLQIEIDLTTELNGVVTIYEAKNSPKNKWIENFNIHQIYNPFRYYYELKIMNQLKIEEINACYLVRMKTEGTSHIRLYNYTFANPEDITSLKLLKKREYKLIRKS